MFDSANASNVLNKLNWKNFNNYFVDKFDGCSSAVLRIFHRFYLNESENRYQMKEKNEEKERNFIIKVSERNGS